MKHEVINLREEAINGFMPTLTTYIIDDNSGAPKRRKRPAIVVCPGGGYGFCSKREAEPVALKFVSEGFCAFVVDYTVAPNCDYLNPQKDASNAIRIVRENADEWGIDKDKIAILGFSAGGHLAASIATLWDEEPIKTPDESNKPNAAVLCYPVITSDEKDAHMGSFINLCGEDKELIKRMSLEDRVSEKTPPCFLWHTAEDQLVPVENSLRFANALSKNKISFEMHIFPKGAHGLSLANADTSVDINGINDRVAEWIELAVKWLDGLFGFSEFQD